MSIDSRATAFALILMALAVSGGCNGAKRDLAPVEGTVTLDGNALASGVVITIPLEGKGARGEIDSSGHFVLETTGVGEGAVPGTHRVAVTSYMPTGNATGPETQLKSLVPQNYTNPYNSGLTIEVERDKPNEVTLELSSRK